METDLLRDLLIVTGSLLVLGLLADGLRRMWLARREVNELNFGLQSVPANSVGCSSELPNGGARVMHDSERDSPALEQTSGPAAQRVTPTFHFEFDHDPIVERSSEQAANHPAADGTTARPLTQSEPLAQAAPQGRPLSPVLDPESGHTVARTPPPATEDGPLFGTSAELQAASERPESMAGQSAPAPANDRQRQRMHVPVVEEIINLNLTAADGQTFCGDRLARIFADMSLHFGEMSIFHRHQDEGTTGPILFSVANGVEPGTFDPGTVTELSTPALCFFMGLPGQHNAQETFRTMVDTAQAIAEALKGSLRDDQHSILTRQTLGHYYERISDFERRQLSELRKTEGQQIARSRETVRK